MAEQSVGGGEGALAVQRSRLVRIDPGGTLHAGDHRARFDSTDSSGDSLLLSYLRLVRAARDQRRSPVIELRRADLDVLGEHLGEDTATVVDRLGELMGASIAQRRALVTLLASGIAVLTFAGGAAAAVGGRDGAGPADAPRTSIVPATSDAPASPAWAPESDDALDVPTIEIPAIDMPTVEIPTVEIPTVEIPTVETPTVEPPVQITEPAEPAEPAIEPAAEPIEVAVGEPPVPAPPAIAPPETEPEVAVGEPPVPAPPASSSG